MEIEYLQYYYLLNVECARKEWVCFESSHYTDANHALATNYKL